MAAKFKTTRNCPGSYKVTLTNNGEFVDQVWVERSMDDDRYWTTSMTDSFFGSKLEAVETVKELMLMNADY